MTIFPNVGFMMAKGSLRLVAETSAAKADEDPMATVLQVAEVLGSQTTIDTTSLKKLLLST